MIKYKHEGGGTMFGKNLKYYRLKNNMSMSELAKIVNVSPMAISYYEKGERKPNMDIIKALAKALGVRVTDFLASRDQNLVFSHAEFRKNSKMSGKKQEFIREEVEEYFGRFYETVNILGGEVLSKAPERHMIQLSTDAEVNAKEMRSYLNLPLDGPVGNLIEILENKGILVYLCEIENDDFSGLNGTVNGRSYIIINKKMTAERIRSTIAHEMAHFLFIWPEDMEDKVVEKTATAISGAFLFLEEDVRRELGVKRTKITNDMIGVCKEYGVSMYLLVKRANLVGVINDNIATNFYINAGKAGWRKNEPQRIERENTRLFLQLVYRAVSENEITVQKGAELLKTSCDNVVEACKLMEVGTSDGVY